MSSGLKATLCPCLLEPRAGALQGPPPSRFCVPTTALPWPSPFPCQTLTVPCHAESPGPPTERMFLCPLDRGDLELSATCLSSHSEDRLGRPPPRAVLSRSAPPPHPIPARTPPVWEDGARPQRLGGWVQSQLGISPAPPVRQRQTKGLAGSPPGQPSFTPPQTPPPSPRVHTMDAYRASTVSQLCSGSWGLGRDETESVPAPGGGRAQTPPGMS